MFVLTHAIRDTTEELCQSINIFNFYGSFNGNIIGVSTGNAPAYSDSESDSDNEDIIAFHGEIGHVDYESELETEELEQEVIEIHQETSPLVFPAQ